MGNTEKVQHIYESFGRGDVPAILEHLAETVEWEYGIVSTDVPWLQKRRGRGEVPKFFESLAEFEMQKFEPKTFLENDNVVVVLLDVEFKVKATGTTVVEEDETHIWYFDSEGKVSRFAHKVDTHQHCAAYKGEALQKTQASG
jgi:ketosteroid isomerase-like protein